MFLIKKKYALYFFLIFPFIKPGLFEYIPLIDNLYNVMRIFSFAYIMTAYYKKMFRNKLFIVIFLFEMISLLGTIIEGGNILRWLMTAAINISAIAITFIWAEDDLYSYIRIVGKYINILLLINLIGIMIYPNGIISTSAGGCNFLDIDNLMFPFLLFSVLLNGYAIYLNVYSKLAAIIFICIALITPILVMCGTAIMAFAAAVIVFMVFGRKHSKELANPKMLFIIFIVLFVLVVCVQNINIVSSFVTQVLGKSITLSGRIYIWNDFFRYIRSKTFNLFVGTGVRDGYYFYSPSFFQDVHPHNQILYVLLENGFLGLMVWLYTNFMCIKHWRMTNEKISLLTSTLYFTFLICMLGEVFRNNFFFFGILTLMYLISNGMLAINNTERNK